MRTLITGITGFTGHYLKSELIKYGHDVVGMTSDLNDAAAVNQEMKQVQPDWVVHLAGVTFVGHGEPNDFYRVNLMGARNLLSALTECGKKPSCVLLASSANVYGNCSEGVLNENTPLNPANDYAVSKIAMEYMVRVWADTLPIVVARPFNYTGVGQQETFLLPKIVAHVRRKAKVIELGNIEVWRDFSDVRAVVRAYRRLLEIRPAGEVVNICSGHTFSIREILNLAMEITGYEIDVKVNPDFVRDNEVKVLCGDPSKLKKLIGDWNSFLFEETLQWMIAQ